MDYLNIDLQSEYERNQSILDSYDIETVLLEINCNFRKEDITPNKVKTHINKMIDMNAQEAKEIFAANLDNICKHALNEKLKTEKGI